MDEEQDFAYAVSEKALRHIAETAGREVPGVVAIRSRSVSVAGGIVRVHLDIVLFVTPILSPSCSCVRPFSLRSSAMNFPIFIRSN